MTKKDKIVIAAKQYVKAVKEVTACKQEHFKQHCQYCAKHNSCKLYDKHFDKWTKLERAVNE